MDFFSQTDNWLGMLGSAAVLVLGYVVRTYLIPFLKVGKRHHYALLIATLADEITDDLRTKYSKNEWLKHLDEAVDRLIELCEISSDVTQRAVNAAASRK